MGILNAAQRVSQPQGALPSNQLWGLGMNSTQLRERGNLEGRLRLMLEKQQQQMFAQGAATQWPDASTVIQQLAQTAPRKQQSAHIGGGSFK